MPRNKFVSIIVPSPSGILLYSTGGFPGQLFNIALQDTTTPELSSCALASFIKPGYKHTAGDHWFQFEADKVNLFRMGSLKFALGYTEKASGLLYLLRQYHH